MIWRSSKESGRSAQMRTRHVRRHFGQRFLERDGPLWRDRYEHVVRVKGGWYAVDRSRRR